MAIEDSGAISFLNDNGNLYLGFRAPIVDGVNTQVYGPYLSAMLTRGVEQIEAGELEVDPTIQALAAAGTLYAVADKRYCAQENPIGGVSLEEHQDNVLNGEIKLVEEEHAMTPSNSRYQVKHANGQLKNRGREVEATLAALNYSAFFNPRTMATAAHTLSRGEIDELIETAVTTQEAMPHLSVSNWAIGQTVAGIYSGLSRLEKPLRMRVFDVGAGHGATLAALISSLRSSEDVDPGPQLAITSLETTPEFFEELERFARSEEGASSLGLDVEAAEVGKGQQISQYGALTVVKGDAVPGVIEAKQGRYKEDEVVVVVGNYSWHRLPSTRKREIMRNLSTAPNVVFLIGDLSDNTSVVNRRYFNLAANGPLNAGNRDLTRQFESYGFDVKDTGALKPSAMDDRLARRIVEDRENDGHLWIAVRGQEAYKALDLVPIAK